MKAYVIGRVAVHDPIEFKKYSAQTPGIVERYGGKVLSKGARFRITEGTRAFSRFVVLEFPSFAAAERFVDSDEYQQAAAIRRESGISELDQVIVEAGEPLAAVLSAGLPR